MHQVINVNDDDKMRYVYSDLETDPPWVFVGSTISLFSPSSIPNGGEVSKGVTSWLVEKNKDLIGDEFFDSTSNLFAGVLFEHLFERSPNADKVKTSINYFLKDAPANSLHESLIQALSSGIIAGIVTTNYDLCFEHTNEFANRNIKIIVNEDDASTYSVGDKIIFKIHGTCNNDKGEAIHCTLKDERTMQNWKRDFLARIFVTHPYYLLAILGMILKYVQKLSSFMI